LDHVKLGPFGVIEKIGKVNYRLDLPEGMKIHPVFHVSLLEKAPPGATYDQRTQVTNNEEEEYEVEKFLDCQLMDDQPYYLTKWKGYDDAENTWEPLSNLDQAQQAVAQFHQQNPQFSKNLSQGLTTQSQKSNRRRGRREKDQPIQAIATETEEPGPEERQLLVLELPHMDDPQGGQSPREQQPHTPRARVPRSQVSLFEMLNALDPSGGSTACEGATVSDDASTEPRRSDAARRQPAPRPEKSPPPPTQGRVVPFLSGQRSYSLRDKLAKKLSEEEHTLTWTQRHNVEVWRRHPEEFEESWVLLQEKKMKLETDTRTWEDHVWRNKIEECMEPFDKDHEQLILFSKTFVMPQLFEWNRKEDADYWNPNNHKLGDVMEGFIPMGIKDFKEVLHDAWMDYELYHKDRTLWAKEGFDRGDYEEWTQHRGTTRALANLQSALDRILSQDRPALMQVEQLPDGNTTRQTAPDRAQRPQGLTMVTPSKEASSERESRDTLEAEDATFGMINQGLLDLVARMEESTRKSKEWREGRGLTLSRDDLRKIALHEGFGTITFEGEGSVTDHTLSTPEIPAITIGPGRFELSEEDWEKEIFDGEQQEWMDEPDDNSTGTC
jgi:hypothetical protein